LQKAAGKDAVAKERRRQAKTRYDEAQAQVSLAQEKLTRLGEMFVARAGLVGKLNAACDARAGARRQIVDQVNAHLEEEVNSSRISIKITLAERADVREFEGLLNEIVAWTKARLHHKERKVSRLVGRLSPREVRDALLDRNAAVFQLLDGGMEDKVTETQANGIVEECSPTRYLSLSDTTKIKYYDPIKVDAVLRLDEVTRDDTPEILLNQNPEEGGAFAPIAQLSPGQRCSAMLPIILLRGNCPVVIDQPEDNLDNRLICDVVVDVLQRLKEHRQIIVATHNANIPVSADAEQVVVMEALGRNAGRVAAQGPIDDEQIVSQVKAIMEGGDEAFRLRARRYNYELRPRRVS
jgi:ATPase subunit of ABC transporter with duplicated ATPase domains